MTQEPVYTTMVHTVAAVNHPVQQGMWGVFEAFFDTLVVCNLTCFCDFMHLASGQVPV